MQRRRWAALLMVASGFAGLGYQIAWTQQTAHWVGHETAAMLAIVAAFFGGIALGAWALARHIDASTRPARWYTGCEIVIGLWGLALLPLMEPASRGLLELMGPQPSPLWQWTVSFAGSFLLLLPATAAMGATLPAMERLLHAGGRSPIALLYAANTAGAVVGVLVSAFVLVPRFGLAATTLICVALNLLCACIAWGWQQSEVAAAPRAATPKASLAILALTGLLGIGYEVLVVRVLSQITENTIFTFAILLAVYLIGTAAGAALYARRSAVSPEARATLLRLQSAACLLGVVVLAFAAPLEAWMMAALGPGMTQSLITEAALACLAFLPPTLVMGALFSHLLSLARERGASFGAALGANTAAAALAPLVFGVWLLPWLGTTLALLLVPVGYLLVAGAWRSLPQVVMAAGVLAIILWRPALSTTTVPDGGRVLRQLEGVAATVSVVEDAAGIATLHINNRQQEGSSATTFSDARQAWLPLLLHPNPERVLFLGLGTGATARSATLLRGASVDAVELLPGVVEASEWFAQRQSLPAGSPLNVIVADARRFVRSAPERYDVIIADNFHPARSGSAALYTREHFSAVRERLAEGGLFCQWLPLHQLDLPTTRSIVRTWRESFPGGWAVLATHSLDTPVLGLISRRDGELLDEKTIRESLASPARGFAAQIQLGEEFSLLGSFIAGPEALGEFGEGAPLNDDNRPVVAYLAPRITYQPDSVPRDRLIELLKQLRIRPAEIFGDVDGSWSRRLTAYWAARDAYLDAGRRVQPTGDVRGMLAQVREPLLSVLRISPDFRPAYEPLVHMAQALSRTEPAEARRLLTTLTNLQATWPEAQAALAELSAR